MANLFLLRKWNFNVYKMICYEIHFHTDKEDPCELSTTTRWQHISRRELDIRVDSASDKV